MTPADPHDLERFVRAQEGTYGDALAELRRGAKRGHWMWFVFPQVAGFGSSPMARFYAIGSMEEACAYLAHPVLATRLADCTAAVLDHPDRAAAAMLRPVDAAKLRSSMTLFEAAARRSGRDGAKFAACLDMFFGGARDGRTLELLGGNSPADRA